MPDLLNENGLQVATSEEIQTSLENGYKAIYGNDIAISSNTQDGQLIAIYTQMATDLREMLMEVYNTFNPTLCRGKMQDVRYALNDMTRKGGTFTIVPITIVVTKTVTLQGLDANYNDVNATSYAIADDAGNQYFLIDTVTLTAGTYTKQFRAQNIGLVQPVLNTITNQVTIVNGVTSVTNASAPTSYGENEETDDEFAIRRERGLENKSQNSIDAILGQLLELEGLTQAAVYNHDYANYPSSTDADGIPLGYIWVIAEGGSNADIATVIYANMAGSGTKGSVSVNVPTASGQTLGINFDRPIAVPLHIRFNFQHTSPNIFYIAENLIKQYIVDNLKFKINQYADTAEITTIAQAAIETNGGNGVCTDLEIWDGSTTEVIGDWATPTNNGTANMQSVVYANNGYIAVGYQYILTSTDGKTWGNAQQVGSNSWYSIIYANNKYIAVGGSGMVTYSNDGSTWASPINTGTSNTWYDVVYGNNKYIAVGQIDNFATSSDGETWTKVANATGIGNIDWQFIKYINNKFIIGGQWGYIAYSSDGSTWTSAGTIGSSYWYDLAYGNNVYIAVGGSGNMVTSSDGVNWGTPFTVGSAAWKKIIFYKNKFIAITSNGNVATSTDGVNWSTPISTGLSTAYGLTSGDNILIATGSSNNMTYQEYLQVANWTDFIETQTKQNIFTVDTSNITITEVQY